MIGGVIVSHGKLAEELLNAVIIILGEAPNIEAISIGWYDDVEESKKKISQSLKKVDQKNGVIIFTDMFGGTPSNLSFSFLAENKVEIITGVNMPMLITFSTARVPSAASNSTGTGIIMASTRVGRTSSAMPSRSGTECP